MRRPGTASKDGENAVDMVRHHDEGVELDEREVTRYRLPEVMCQTPGVARAHFAVHDVAEETTAVPCDGRHEVRARLRVVVAGQPDRTPVVVESDIGSGGNHWIGHQQTTTQAGTVWPGVAWATHALPLRP